MGPGDGYDYSFSSLKHVPARELRLYICYGSKDHSDIGLLRTADYFAKITGAHVIATAGKVNFFPMYFGVVLWLDNGFPWDTIYPMTTKPDYGNFPVVEVLY